MTVGPTLLIHNEFELQDLVETLGRDGSLIERDFALMMIAAGLVTEYGDSLCFKGGFVLRHVFGHERFSKDIDATRINPPKSKLDSGAVAETIQRSGMRNLLTLKAPAPARDSARRRERIEECIAAMAGEYDDAVSAVAPDAPSYSAASQLVLRELGTLLA